MDPYSFEEDPGWFSSLISWTQGLWAYWTAPSPENLPFDRLVLLAHLGLCLTRFAVLRRKNEYVLKQSEPELVTLAREESPLAEIKAVQYLSVLRFQKLMDVLETHLTLLKNSVDLPASVESLHDAVRSVIYAASQSHRIQELHDIRQQLLQKYGPALAIIKIDLIDRELVDIFDTSRTTIDALDWLNKNAPGRCWAEKLKAASQNIQNHIPSTLSSSPILSPPSEQSKERIIEIPSAPNDSDNDDAMGGLGDSHNSGPTDSPIPPLEVIDFPSVPLVLYPSLSLSDSLENPQTIAQSTATN
jgi:hypothetical protein